jgi:hypothetical protein
LARLGRIELLVAVTASRPSLAQGKGDWSFQRVGTFANYRSAPIGDETVSEIVAAVADGKTLVYTDSPRGTIGFIDITDPSSPRRSGEQRGPHARSGLAI